VTRATEQQQPGVLAPCPRRLAGTPESAIAGHPTRRRTNDTGAGLAPTRPTADGPADSNGGLRANASSAASASALGLMSPMATFSSRWAGLDVLGMIRILLPWARSQASPTWPGVALARPVGRYLATLLGADEAEVDHVDAVAAVERRGSAGVSRLGGTLWRRATDLGAHDGRS